MSSPVVTSPVYPDRLIRALPKRSLRSRLSEEAAESIPFPPNPPSTSLPAYNQYTENGEYLNENKVHVQHNGHICDHDHEDEHDHHHYHDHHHDHDHEHDGHHHHCHHHHHHCHHEEDEEDEEDADSGEDGGPVVTRRTNGYRTVPRSPRSPRAARNARYGVHTAKSSSSGLDGYDAFENTNNKKKRKIPTSGSMGMHHASLATDLAHMALNGSKDGLASGHDDGSSVGQYYGSGSAAMLVGMGIQGAGRGRSGRRVSGRNPLGVSVNGSNVRSAARHDQLPAANLELKDEDPKPDQGIISAAIANATALLRKPLQKGQENVGVLDQEPKSTPTNSQFTFTCESDAVKGVSFPEQSLYAAGYSQRANNMPAPAAGPNQKFATHGTQTSPGVAAPNNQHLPPAQQPSNAQVPAQGKKPRRRRGDLHALAARQRRLQQEYNNLHHPPAPEDVWICEFCEYESIFGVPPHALIRQYEIKDRRERRRLAEKRRLLEKAKLKGRKGKKQTKNAAKVSGNTAQQAANQQPYDQQPIDPMLGDDYLDDGYDDDPIPMPTPAPQTPMKQPMPGSYDTSSGKSGGVGKPG